MPNYKTKNEIINAYKNYKLIPFIGSGFSSVVAPTWNDFITGLFGELNTDTYNTKILKKKLSDPLEATEFFIIKKASECFGNDFKKGKEEFFKYIIDTLSYDIKYKFCLPFVDIDGSKISLSNHYLLCKKFNNRTIYTTNWDNLIESIGNFDVYRTKSDLIEMNSIPILRKGRLIKFHGSIFPNKKCDKGGESLIACKSDYWNRMLDNNNPFDILFQHHLTSKKFLFIGYSFSDPNISLQIFQIVKYLKALGNNSNKIFWAAIEYRDDPRIEVLKKHAGIEPYFVLTEENEAYLKNLEKCIKIICDNCKVNIPIEHNFDENIVCKNCNNSEKISKQDKFDNLRKKYIKTGTKNLFLSLN